MAAAKKAKDAAKETTAKKAMSKAQANRYRGSEEICSPTAEKAMSAQMTVKYKPRQGNFPNQSSGRRSAFAKWMTVNATESADRASGDEPNLAETFWSRHSPEPQMSLEPTGRSRVTRHCWIGWRRSL